MIVYVDKASQAVLLTLETGDGCSIQLEAGADPVIEMSVAEAEKLEIILGNVLRPTTAVSKENYLDQVRF